MLFTCRSRRYIFLDGRLPPPPNFPVFLNTRSRVYISSGFPILVVNTAPAVFFCFPAYLRSSMRSFSGRNTMRRLPLLLISERSSQRVFSDITVPPESSTISLLKFRSAIQLIWYNHSKRRTDRHGKILQS